MLPERLSAATSLFFRQSNIGSLSPCCGKKKTKCLLQTLFLFMLYERQRGRFSWLAPWHRVSCSTVLHVKCHSEYIYIYFLLFARKNCHCIVQFGFMASFFLLNESERKVESVERFDRADVKPGAYRLLSANRLSDAVLCESEICRITNTFE